MKVSLNRVMAMTALVLALFAAIRSQISWTQTQTQRTQLIQNDDVKVWRTQVLPNAPLTMHRHDHPRVIIPIAGGTMNIVDQGGAKEVHIWETGKAYWLPANPPNTMHADVNAGDKPIEVVVVELEKEK
jgi:beta-alanine degradation protein BauB